MASTGQTQKSQQARVSGGLRYSKKGGVVREFNLSNKDVKLILFDLVAPLNHVFMNSDSIAEELINSCFTDRKTKLVRLKTMIDSEGSIGVSGEIIRGELEVVKGKETFHITIMTYKNGDLDISTSVLDAGGEGESLVEVLSYKNGGIKILQPKPADAGKTKK